MPRFWISWREPVGPDGDPRPNGEWPVPDGIKRYWESGVGLGPGGAFATMCAVVDADSQGAAEALIARSWPNHGEWRFCEPKEDDWRPGDRFPWPDEVSAGEHKAGR